MRKHQEHPINRLAQSFSQPSKPIENYFSGLRIGYAPYDHTLRMPGDRYRFCHYARRRNIKYEIADPSKQYDLLVISSGADLSVWERYPKGNTKIVFQYINSYLAESRGSPRRVFRGFAKFLVRQNSHLLLDYAAGIRRMCRNADAIVCATPEQQEEVSQFCSNVHLILDSYEPLVRSRKTDYSAGEVFNFVWQGFPENVAFFAEIRNVLKRIHRNHKIAFHIITRLDYGQYLRGKVGKPSALETARRLLDNAYVYSWNEDTCSSIVTACDMALIPIPLDKPFEVAKPENKLLLFWQLAMPVIVSATPAYTRTMQQCGLQLACKTEREWEDAVVAYMQSEEARRNAGQRGRAFVDTQHTDEAILHRWDELFDSVLGGESQPEPVRIATLQT